jgi:predicted O-methyltransferase YrrM
MKRMFQKVGQAMEEYPYSGDYNDPLLAELYDQSQTFSDDVDLLRKLIGSRGPLNILECFSGTGRILIPLLEDGHTVTGIEIAPAMNARAKEKIACLPSGIRTRAVLRTSDVLTGDWGSGYDLVILGANAFYELPDPALQERCIRFAALALNPNGHLFVDNNDYKGDWGDAPLGRERKVFEGVGSHGTFGRFTSRDIRFDKNRHVLYMERELYKRAPDGTETVTKYIGKKHPVSKDEVRGWLDSHGFEVLDIFGDREGNPYTKKSDRAIFWARSA